MNNEKLQAAKDQAAREYGHGDFQQALGYLVAGGDVMEFQDIEDRAMEIYAEKVNGLSIEIVKKLSDWSEKYPRGRVYAMSKMSMDDELVEIEKCAKEFINQLKTTKP